MKQVLYTCARCAKQEAVEATKDFVPSEWATLQYERIYTVQRDGKDAVMQTTSETHACGDCARDVLDYIEGIEATKTAGKGVPPGPGDQQALVNFANDLLRVNGQMFEGTLRALNQQVTRLHEQVTTLTTQNAILSRDLDDARENARLEP